jgi:DNA-binding MarR family transcriptional regulator/GNAT superfamily N-acetyltransferase
MHNAEAISQTDNPVAAIRAFNRFYTKKLGVLDQHLMQSPFSLSEARVIYELAHRGTVVAKQIGEELGLDPGYLSRIVQGFEDKGLITRTPLPSDRRKQQLALSAKGWQAFAKLDRSSDSEVATMLDALDDGARHRLVCAMGAITDILQPAAAARPSFLLRSHRPGDIGWVIARHGAVYAQEYGWDISFEALVAEIGAQFIRSFDPAREHCWIAEVDGEPVGSIFLVRSTDEIAKLRLLLVEKKARGLGIGRALVEQCIRFAREAGYKGMVLWTQSCLTAARDIYRHSGFRLTDAQPNHSFGVDLVSETWELKF